MVRMSLRVPDELHEKLRWIAYRDRMSQHAVVLAILCEALSEVEVPEGNVGSDESTAG